MTYRFGDRVRLGALRGGIVLPFEGRLRVVTPDGRVHWLDHWVTDEGPDGRIFPDEWSACDLCGNPTKGSGPIPTGYCADAFCRNCSEDVRPLSHGLPGDVEAVRRYQAATFQRLPAWAQAWMRTHGSVADLLEVA